MLMGVGNGTFASPVFYPLTHNGVRLLAGPGLNHNGRLDLGVRSYNVSRTRRMLWPCCSGMEMELFSRSSLPCREAPTTSLRETFNDDGNVDLALAGGAVRVVLGNGDGTFQHQPVLPRSLDSDHGGSEPRWRARLVGGRF